MPELLRTSSWLPWRTSWHAWHGPCFRADKITSHYRSSRQPELKLIGNNRASILLLLTAVACLLFASCVNIANSLLARAVGQQQQIAVASALGAGRGEVLQMASREIVLLAFAGGIGGIGLAAILVPFMENFLPASLAFRGTLTLGWERVFACTILTAFSALLAGAAPAWTAFRINPQTVLSREGRLASETRGSRNMRRALVSVKVANQYCSASHDRPLDDEEPSGHSVPPGWL